MNTRSCSVVTNLFGKCSPGPNRPPARHGLAKRIYDVVFSALGLIVLSPVFFVIALLIKVLDGGPTFYRQRRVGLYGVQFQICKFRTMISGNAPGPRVTRGGDPRVTPLGRLLRKLKLDELPQLWNVLKGEMSLVGPRPEVPCYVNAYTPDQRRILNYKPGITDLATLNFRDEESLLRNAQHVEQFYVQQCIPRKVDLNLQYAQRATLLTDTRIIFQTIFPSWCAILLMYVSLLTAGLSLSSRLVDAKTGSLLTSSAFALIISLQAAGLVWRNQCKALLTYFSTPEFRETCVALGLPFFLLLAAVLLIPVSGLPPVNVLVIDLILSIALLCGFRILARLWREGSFSRRDKRRAITRVGIIGATETGAQLAREISARRRLGRKVQVFFDDNAERWQRRLHEIPVVGMPECLLQGWSDKLDEVIIAMPDAPADRLQQIQQIVETAKLKCSLCWSAEQIWST